MRSEALLYRQVSGNDVSCFLCSHRCLIKDGEFGFCGVRQNKKGRLYTYAYADVAAANFDPIEKKPLFHVLPGSKSFSIAAYGCNFRCGFCQNWQISQTGYSEGGDDKAQRMPPREVVKQAKAGGAASISYTYTEPTIFFEYAYETAGLAGKEGLLNILVTNGYMTREALDLSKGYFDAANVDLKAFSDEFYRKVCKARLKPVCESIRHMKEIGIWVEVTTLVIPGLNDSKEELGEAAAFIASVGREIPWHISRFHPDYKMNDVEATPVETLEMAYGLGKAAGLKYVYTGNVPGGREDTFCGNCNTVLIKRQGFSVSRNNLKGGLCPSCNTRVEGLF
ncbi:MAG: AmmeMemoRadiSam system radical SAM enzyme [Candidatus Omnitrophica bacterium]|nr:AmmeMemoRadiSam system radical SAM enzyme [Candidatus Omnitrophota bacterium]